ncbi:MAG: pyridoxamine 5'-phosphate oxidase family protein [Candidatus Woesearchaeota archaeon]
MKEALEFMKSQESMAIASYSKDLWIANIFYIVDDDFKVYFISPKDAKHSKDYIENPEVSFSVIWYNKNDHEDRKGIQGKGICRPAKNDKELMRGVDLHNKQFPVFKERINYDYIRNNSCVWIIEPSLIKYWDDELYSDKTKEFHFK